MQSIERNTPAKHRGWFYHFKKAVTDVGSDIDVDNPCLALILLNRMTETENKRLTSLIKDTSRLSVFDGLEITVAQQPFLLLPRSIALYVASLRSSTHFLNVERLRRTKHRPPREERLCPFCPTVEDERHAFLDCLDHHEARQRFINKISYSSISKWPSLPRQHQMRIILSPPQETKLRYIIGTFIHDVLKRARSRYMGRLEIQEIVDEVSLSQF